MIGLTGVRWSSMNRALWIVQGLLAALFLFAGGAKFTMSDDQALKQMSLSLGFLHFIGVAEILGALGLILPGLLKIQKGLTPLAATGLLIIMIGAVATTAKGPQLSMAVLPFITGVLCAFVAWGRWRKVV